MPRLDVRAKLDQRDAAQVVSDLLKRLPGYVPGWTPQPGSVGDALTQIFGRYMEVLIERLNAAPDKNFLAFLDLLGQSLVEARPARAPVVFKFSPPTPAELPAAITSSAVNLPAPPEPLALPVINMRVPQATQVTATPPGGGTPLIFETENAIALVSAKLAQTVSLWPGQDSYSDHSAALAAGTPITLFRSKTQTPHSLYLAHDGYFALKGSARVEIEFDLLSPSSVELPILWEYWDGQGWHAFGDPDLKTNDATATADLNDATQGLTRSGVISLCGDCVDTQPTTVNGLKAYWLRGRLTEPLPPDLSRQDALVKRIRANTVIERLIDPDGINAKPTLNELAETSGVKPDAAFADGTSLDLSKAFYPFGQSPAPGNVFYFSSDEVFSKPNATARFALYTTTGPLGSASGATSTAGISWEYWDGARWVKLTLTNETPTFKADTLSGFTVPENGIPVSKLNDKDGRWVRARITSGGFYTTRSITVGNTTLTFNENLPPLLADIRLGYVYRSPRDFPEICLSHNDFAYKDHTADVRWTGTGFAAYHAVTDVTPALYLGFDKTLPVDLISLYLDIEEAEGQAANPPLVWEYWDGAAWRETAVQDDTARLTRPGMIAFVGAVDSAKLARFDGALTWLRGRLREDGLPVERVVNGIYPNAVWAMQATTTRDETLGSGSGEPNQTFFFRNRPVLSDEVIEVRELDGARAAVELPILAREVDSADLNVIYGANNAVSEVWVRWKPQPNLYLSGANDRHYVLERSQGRVIFGDGVNGRLLPAGTDNVAARSYRWGGGAAGNVAAGAITQLLGGIPYVTGVNNPKPAEGGADNETVEQIHARGPQALRHRGRALAAADYEALAREASPGVAVARALPATHPSGRPAAGWIKLIIVPSSTTPQPQPSFGLRRQVQEYLLARAPLGMAGVYVTGPTYLPVGVAAVVAPLDLTQAWPVGVAARRTLEAFFHPLTGGPNGVGWPFGRDVYISDVAAALEAVDGVDYVQELELLLDGVPQGDQVIVPPDRIVVAGAMQIRIRASEG